MTLPSAHLAFPATEQPRVLLVDDDEVNLTLTALALRKLGFDIAECPSGDDALRQVTSRLPDVVVLDALMPGIDGFETCRRLRAMPGFESIPVLMLTGLDDEASIALAYEVGATDFFVKSNQWSLLAGRLSYMLRSARTRQELERSKSKLARAHELARMGSFDWRLQQGTLVLSAEGLSVFKYPANSAPGFRELARLIPPDERKVFLRTLREMLARGSPLTTDIVAQLADGETHIIHIEAQPEGGDKGLVSGYTGIVQDVTDRRLAEDRIRYLANFDALTGLPNRHQLMERAKRAINHARRLGHQTALLLIDLDRFKIVNDTLGHGAGDELLKEVSLRLRSCVRHSDQIMEGALEAVGSRSHRLLEAVARLGGDEFVALLPEVIDEADAQRVADRILDVMREPILIEGQECFVTASVGFALYPRDGETVLDLLRSSDLAMYAVKAQGRNSSLPFKRGQASIGREKLELESALHKAIERNELVLHYQPKVDVRSAKMVGVEALMRWRRNDTLVAPADFIPMAEASGLIVPMTRWAIREAARQAKAWEVSFGFSDSIAVNLPSQIFQRPDLVEDIHSAVTDHGVLHRCLELEITETSLMKDLDKIQFKLEELDALGVEISIDDFGTGYSSLAYLTTLKIREVKIDRKFVQNLGVGPQSSAVITAIIALARSLNLKVVAEGVENQRQQDLLFAEGCTLMQGFLFSKPLPPNDIQSWMERVVLPRKAPWMPSAAKARAGADDVVDVGRRS